ncbi:hypothetical protein PFISCL1PPCAC_10200, partial [Pristionchus fissidentatus]
SSQSTSLPDTTDSVVVIYHLSQSRSTPLFLSPNHSTPRMRVVRPPQKQALIMEMSEAEIVLVKEDNRRRVKRAVGCVAISITVLAFLMVGMSLALGGSIDRLVEDAWKENERSQSLPSGINLTQGK